MHSIRARLLRSTAPSLAEIPQLKGGKRTVMRKDVCGAGGQSDADLEEQCQWKVSHNPKDTQPSFEWHLKLSAHGHNVDCESETLEPPGSTQVSITCLLWRGITSTGAHTKHLVRSSTHRSLLPTEFQ